MPVYNVQAPNGRIYHVEGPEGASQQDIFNFVLAQDPSAGKAPKPATGIMGAFGAGLEQGIGETARGLGEATGIQSLINYGREKAAAAQSYQPYTEEQFQADKARPGILPTLGAYAQKYGEEIAQGTGSMIGRYAAPTLAGTAAAAALPEAAGAGTILAAKEAAFAAINAPAYIGQEIAKQKDRGEEPNYLRAVGYGIAHAAVDQLAGRILHAPMRGILGKTAAEEAAPLAKEVLAGRMTAEEASQQLSGTVRNVIQGTGQNAVLGTGMMVSHTMLDRAEEGKSLTSPDAMEAYGHATMGAIGMAPIFGFMHGRGARDAASKMLSGAEQTRADLLAEQQRQKDALSDDQKAAYKQTDGYLIDLQDQAAQYGQRLVQLKQLMQGKADPADQVAVAEKQRARQEYAELIRSDEYKNFQQELQAAVPRIRELQKRVGEQQTQADYAKSMQQEGAQADVFGNVGQAADTSDLGQLKALAAQQAEFEKQRQQALKDNNPQLADVLQARLTSAKNQMEDLAPHPVEYAANVRYLQEQMDQAQKTFSEAQDTQTAARASDQYSQFKTALDALKKYAPYVAKPDADTLENLYKKLQKAKDKGDMEAARNLIPKIQKLETEPELFGDQNKIQDYEDLLASQMATGREQAEAGRQNLPYEPDLLQKQQALAQRGFDISGLDFKQTRLQQEIDFLQRLANQKGQRTDLEQAIYDQRLEAAKSAMADHNRAVELQQEIEQLKGQSEHAQDVALLQAELDKLTAKPEPQQFETEQAFKDREARTKELKQSIDDLQKQAEQGQLPEEKQQDLANKQQELEALQNKIAEEERRRNTTEVADNILTDASDEKVSDLVDQMLEKSSQHLTGAGFDTMNQRKGWADSRDNAKDARKESFANLVDAVGSDDKVEQSQIPRHTQSFADNGVAEVNLNRLLNGGDALHPEAATALRAKLMSVGDNIEKGISAKAFATQESEALTAKKEQYKHALKAVKKARDLFAEASTPEEKVIRQRTVDEAVRARDKIAREYEAIKLRELTDQAESLIESYSHVIKEEKKQRASDTAVDRRQRILERLQENQQSINALSEKIKRAGNPKGEKLEQLNAWKDQRRALIEESTNLRKGYNQRNLAEESVAPESLEVQQMRRQLRVIENQLENTTLQMSPRVREQLETARDSLKNKLGAPAEAPEAYKEPTALLPGIVRGAAVEANKGVTPEKLTEARTAMGDARTRVEALRAALKNTGNEPIYFREVAQRIRADVNEFDRQLEQTPNSIQLAKLSPVYEQKRKDITYFENLAKVAEAGKGNYRAKLEAELDKANTKLEKAESGYAALEAQQRRFEAQEDIRRGALPGQRIAENIQAGRTTGYVNPLGKYLTKPKKAISWDIKTETKTTPVEPNKLKEAQTALTQAKDLTTRLPQLARSLADTAGQQKALDKQIEVLNHTSAKLEKVLADVYPENKARAIEEELAKVNGELGDVAPLRDIEALYGRIKNGEVKNQLKELNDLIGFLNANVRKASQEVVAIRDKAVELETNRQKSFASKTKYKTEQARLAANKAFSEQHTRLYEEEQAAMEKYLQARREQLQLTKAYGEDLRNTLIEQSDRIAELSERKPALQKQAQETSALHKGLQTILEKAKADAEREVSKQQFAKEQERMARNQALDEAAEAREKLERAKQGLGLKGTRYERDTAGQIGTALQAEAKRRLAEAETNLAKLTTDRTATAEQIREATNKVSDITTELDTVYGKAPRKETELGVEKEAFGEQPGPVEGMRLPERRRGPLARNVSGSKKLFQSGVRKLTEEGLSGEAASDIGLAHYEAQLKENPKNAAVRAKYEAAIEGKSKAEIEASLSNGRRLLGSERSLELVAKREQYRLSIEQERLAEERVKAARTPEEKAVAQDALDTAVAASDKAQLTYAHARDDYENQHLGKSKRSKADLDFDALGEESVETAPKSLDLGQEEDFEAHDAPPSLFRTVEGTATNGVTHYDRAFEHIGTIIAPWKRRPQITLLRSYEELPQRIREQAERDGAADRIPGAYDTQTNHVYLIANKLFESKDIIDTLAHEVIGHYGIRSILGESYGRVMDQLYDGNKAVREAADAKMQGSKALDRRTAVEEVLATMAEDPKNFEQRSLVQKLVALVKNGIAKLFGQKVSDDDVRELLKNAHSFVIEGKGESGKGAAPIKTLFRKTAEYGTDNDLTEFAKKVIAEPKSFKEQFKPSSLALQAEMQAVDMRAPLREALRAGAEGISRPELFKQAMYHITKNDQKVSLAMTTMSNGPLEVYRDTKGLYGVRSTNKNSGADVFEAISAIPQGNAQAKVNLATAYMIAQRANNKGVNRLDIGALGIKQADLDSALAAANANPTLRRALEDVRAKYNAYNEGLIKFNVDTGAIPASMAKELLKEGDFVPFYRVDKNGNAALVFNDNVQIQIGDVRHQPYLDKLKAGETKILPLNESMLQNTLLLTDKAMTTLAQKSVAYALQEIGKGRIPPNNESLVIHKGNGPADPSVIHFQQAPDPNNPKDDGKRWIKVDTKGTLMEGVDPALVVKSLEGTQLALPAGLKLAGVASDLLRTGATRTPLYIAHQLLRDPMAATMTGGVQSNPFMAVMRAGKNYVQLLRNQSATGKTLIEKGLIQSGIFKGDKSDISKFALQLADGKDLSSIEKLIRFADKAAMEADAATRTLVYEDAIKQGLSEVEADMATMESMNFHKRGASATVQYLNRMIPFYNSQIQGLNVLAKAARGNMPYEEQLNIKRKFFNNAFLLAMGGLTYGMAMADNDYYKNAKPYDRYTNMFVFLPGVQEPVKIPIPYEVGWFFSLGAAAADAMRGEVRGEDQRRGLAKMFLNSVPGYGGQIGGLPVPQLFRPSAEVATNLDFNTGQPIVSARLAKLDPAEQYTNHTTEIAKYFGQMTGTSPIMAEHLVRGYFGQIPLAAAAAAESLFKPAGVAPTARASDLPFIGSAFQRRYGGGEQEAMYQIADEAVKKLNAFNAMKKEGRGQDAVNYLRGNTVELQIAPMAQKYQQLMGKLNADTRMIQARNMDPDEKRKRLDKLDEVREQLSTQFKAVAEKFKASDRT